VKVYCVSVWVFRGNTGIKELVEIHDTREAADAMASKYNGGSDHYEVDEWPVIPAVQKEMTK
jgi:hypothetical protein